MQEKLKLLYIVEAMGGGVFTYVVDLANELAPVYDVYIAYATRPQTPTDYKSYFDNRIQLIEVKNFARAVNPMKDLKSFFEIRQIADEVKPDIIHLHSSKAGALGRWAFNGNKTPLFYTPHGYSFLMSNQGFWKRTIYHFIEMISSKRCCTTISCSEGEHKESLKLTKRATYVDNGVNVKELKKALYSVKPNTETKFTVFTLGRICYQKNPVLFNQVALALPEVNFLWIGDGELRNQLTAPNIEITGWVDRQEAIQYSLSADVFILTSLWEGLPISLLEAMYMNKLCIVSNVIGNHDVIHNNENGYVCNNAEEYVGAIRTYQKGKSTELVKNAYNSILKHYNTEDMAKQYIHIYSNYH